MPNRIFRDGFVDSESVAALSDWTHRIYSNLLIKVDDAGRIDGRVAILRSALFPHGTRRRIDEFEKAFREMEAPTDEDGRTLPPLIIRYAWDGKPFLQLTKVQRCSPAMYSKHPWKDGTFKIEYVKVETRDGEKDFVKTSLGSIPSATHTEPIRGLSRECTETETETETETNTKTETKAHGDAVDIPPDLDSPEFSAIWQTFLIHRKETKHALRPTAQRQLLKRLASWGKPAAIAALEQTVANGWQGVFQPKNGEAVLNGSAGRKPGERVVNWS